MDLDIIKEIENGMRNKKIQKTSRNFESLQAKGRLKSTVYGRKLIIECINACKNKNREWINANFNGQIAQNAKFSKFLFEKDENGSIIEKINIDSITAMSVDIILSRLLSSEKTTKNYIYSEIGDSIDNELLYLFFKNKKDKYLKTLEKNIKEEEKLSRSFLMNNLKNVNKQLEIDNKYIHLTPKDKMKLGIVFFKTFETETLNVLIENEECPFFYTEKETDEKGFKTYLRPSQPLLDWIKTVKEKIFESEVHYEPIEYKPNDFKNVYSGGYKTLANPFCKVYSNEYMQEVKKTDLNRLFDVVNTLQNSCFKIHNKTFEVIDYYYKNEIDLLTKDGGLIIPTNKIEKNKIEKTELVKNGLVVYKERRELYKKYGAKSKQVKEFNDKYAAEIEAVRNYKSEIKQQIIFENTNAGKLRQFQNSVSETGRKFLNKSFYLPVQLDGRGRQYYKPSFNPQNTDFIKGLYCFANSKKIDINNDSESLKQFFCQGANEFGQDKLLESEKVEFILNNSVEIYECAKNPFSDSAMWKRADKPVIFLQFCFEFEKFFDAYNANFDHFYTNIVRFSDGKCNGIQHFAAMSRDINAGKLVALIDEDKTLLDIYQAVAKAADLIIKDCLDRKAERFTIEKKVKDKNGKNKTIKVKYIKTKNGFVFKFEDLEIIKKWKKLGGIPRNISKQPTMTIAYNSKHDGRKNQIITALNEMKQKKKYIPFEVTEFKSAADVLSKIFEQACSDVMPNVIEVMKKLEKMASVFCKYVKNEAIEYKTPYFNFPFVQKYKKIKSETVSIEYKGDCFKTEMNFETALVSIRKMANAIAPNLIHSLDSTHMYMVIEEMKKRHSDIEFCNVHDSYGVSPVYAKELNEVIRETFVKLYTENDPFEMLKDSLIKKGNEKISDLINQSEIKLKTLTDKTEIKNCISEKLKLEKDLNDFNSEISEIVNVKGDLDLNSVLTSHRFFS